MVNMSNPNMDLVHYRKMSSADHAGIMTVHREAYIHAYTNVTPDITPEAIQDHLSGDWVASRIASRQQRIESGRSSVQVAELGGVVLGFCEVEPASISMIYVHPYRGRGIGSKLLAAGLSTAQLPNRDVSLSVVPNTPAVNFYKNRGFRPTGRDLSAEFPRLRGGQILPQIELVLPYDQENARPQD